MNKFYLLILIMLTILGCEEKRDPADIAKENIRKAEITDSIVKASTKSVYQDIAKEESKISDDESPVKIISAKFVTKEYSNYKDVFMRWKNTSSKKIVGIRFCWTGVNAFGEAADVGAVIGEIGGGFTDDPLGPGKSGSGTWNVLSRDGKTITKAWVREIAYADGTKWSSIKK